MRILQILRSLGFRIYSRPFELNIIGVRSSKAVPLTFDDKIHVVYKNDNGKWVHYKFDCTTDPSSYYLENPIFPKGTALLKQGQYIGAYRIGFHKGTYKALVQSSPVTVYRNSDRNSQLDLFSSEETGLFGINIHRARSTGSTLYIDKYSAGCQVFKNASDFILFMGLCDKHRSLYGNSFTYSLIDFRDQNRHFFKTLILLGLSAFTSLLGIQLYKTITNEKPTIQTAPSRQKRKL